MESISTISPAITENTECLICKVCTSFIGLKVGVALNIYLYTLIHVGQHSKQARSTPASSPLTPSLAPKP